MWLGLSILRRCSGLPMVWQITASGLPRRSQRLSRAWTNAGFAAVVLAYPLLRGRMPLDYYASLFPFERAAALRLLGGFFGTVTYLSLIYLAWIATDQVRIGVRHAGSVVARRLAAVPFSALLGAVMEELLFRAVFMAELLESMSPAPAVAVGALVFAAAHYVRRVKRYWTFAGHVGLGVLLCTCFAATHSLWLPIGVHAGGIFVIMGVRPFVRYTGPGWLVGASIFPYAGAAGVLGLSLLTYNLWLLFGATQ